MELNTSIAIHYYDTKNCGKKDMQACQGDLFLIVNALMDYADILEEFTKQKAEILNAWQEAVIPFHAQRCRKVAKKIEEAIGYDREAAIKKCQKKQKKEDDIGEEALVMTIKRGRKKKIQQEPELEKEPAKEIINILELAEEG